MSTKEFIYQRMCIYSGQEFDPIVDEEVVEILRSRFNILLPQRSSLNDSLQSSASDHEMIGLLLQYRALTQ